MKSEKPKIIPEDKALLASAVKHFNLLNDKQAKKLEKSALLQHLIKLKGKKLIIKP